MTSSPFDLAAARRLILARFPLVSGHPDVAGLLGDPTALALLGPALAAPFDQKGVTLVASPEARGPILGALVAVTLGAGLVMIRKDPGNHPGADERLVSAATWRGPVSFQARSFDLSVADRVLVVDDWITTGNSMRAVIELVERAGATVVGAAALVDKSSPETLAELAAHTLVRFDDIMVSSSGRAAVPPDLRHR